MTLSGVKGGQGLHFQDYSMYSIKHKLPSNLAGSGRNRIGTIRGRSMIPSSNRIKCDLSHAPNTTGVDFKAKCLLTSS